MTFIFTDPILGMPPITTAVADGATTMPRPWKLGDVQRAYDPTSYRGGEFIYLKGATSVTPMQWVTYNPLDYSVTRLTADQIGPVAVAMSTNLGSYSGWYQISGVVRAKAATSFADNGNVYATATSGTVDDAVVAGDLVIGAKGAGAEVSARGYADFEINRPYVMDRVGAVPGVAAPISTAAVSVSATQWGFTTSTQASSLAALIQG